MSLSSPEEITSTSLGEENEDSFESTSTSTQLQLVVQQNALHRKTIKQLQNTLINVQEDCATYEERFNRLRQEADKVYNTLFARAARVKELTKQNESLIVTCSVKDQMLYNQRLHLDEFKNSTNDKSVEVLEWQTRYDRANEAYKNALEDLEKKEDENSKLIDRIDELEKSLEIQRGLRESAHAEAQATVHVLAGKDTEILRLTQNLSDATRELMSLIGYLETKGFHVGDEVQKEAQKEEERRVVKSVDRVTEELEAQRMRIEELSQLLATNETELLAAASRATDATTRCSDKEKEIEDLKGEVQKVVTHVVEATGRADELAQSFHAQLAQAQEEVAARNAEVAELRALLELPENAKEKTDLAEEVTDEELSAVLEQPVESPQEGPEKPKEEAFNEEWAHKAKDVEGFIALMREALEEAKAQEAAKLALEGELTLEREATAMLREQLAIKEKELEELLANLQQEKEELTKGEEVLREELARMREELAAKDAEAEAHAQTVKDELTAMIRKAEEDRQKEVSGLLIKLQLANELKEMKATPVVPPKQMADAEIQTEPVSSSYRRVSMQISPTLLVEQLEAMQISNELLRGDNASFQKRMEKMQESQSAMQTKVREAEAKVENLASQLRASKEAEKEQYQQLLQEHAEEKAKLEMAIQELVEQQNSSIEAQETIAEAKVAIARERTLHAKLTEQTSINQNLQNDLRLLYLKQKKDLAELQEEYKHEQYKERYLEVVKDRNAAKQKLEVLQKVMQGTTALQAKGGLIEALKENVNTINLQYHATGEKLGQLKAFQDSSLKASANVKKLERQIKEQKNEMLKLVEEKAADTLTWNVRRTEWEELCAKIAIERDALRTDNERSSAVSTRFEGMLKSTKEENQSLLGEISNLKESNDKMRETNEFLEVQVHSNDETIAQLESQLHETQEQLAIKEEELGVAKEKSEDLTASLASAREEFSQLARDAKELQAKIILESVISNVERTAWKKSEKILNERINQLNISITNYELLAQKNQEEAIVRLNSEIAKLHGETVRLNAEIAKQTAEVARWSRAHKELSEFVEDERAIKEEQLQEAEEKVRDLESRLQQQVDATTELASDKQTLAFECKLLHEQVEEIQKEVENGKSALLAVKEELKQITQEKDLLVERMASSNKSSVELQEAFDKKYEELLQLKKQAEEEWAAKSAEASEHSQAVERELTSKVQAGVQANEVLTSKISEIEAQLTDTEQRLARKSELVQSLQDELAVFAECLKQKEVETEGLAAKLQALLQANTQKETELSVKENEMAMKISQLQSELEIARNQTTQLQTENVRLKKNNSEVTAQTMAVNSRHLDTAAKLRETIAQLSEKADKAVKDCEVAQKALTELKASAADTEKVNTELSEMDFAAENMRQVNIELDNQNKKLLEELKIKNVKLEELNAKLMTCIASNNNLNSKVKELFSEKKAFEQNVALLSENVSKMKTRITSLEANAIKDQETMDQMQQTSSTAMANEAKLESELHKAVGSIRALRNEKDKITSQLELCLKNSMDQEQSTILRMKFNLEREVAALTALNDTAKNESSRFAEEMARYKESVARFKQRTESKMKVQAANLQKAEEEVEALDTCLKQLQILLTRHEPFFSRVPELSQLYQRFLAMMGAQKNTAPPTPQ